MIVLATGKAITTDGVDTVYINGIAWLVANGVAVCRWSDVQSIELA